MPVLENAQRLAAKPKIVRPAKHGDVVRIERSSLEPFQKTFLHSEASPCYAVIQHLAAGFSAYKIMVFFCLRLMLLIRDAVSDNEPLFTG